MLVSLNFPEVTQGRASGDYGFPTGQEAKGEENVVTLGFSSLLFGATGLAPSKDTFWTNGAAAFIHARTLSHAHAQTYTFLHTHTQRRARAHTRSDIFVYIIESSIMRIILFVLFFVCIAVVFGTRVPILTITPSTSTTPPPPTPTLMSASTSPICLPIYANR